LLEDINEFDSHCDQIGEELLEDKDKLINSSNHKIAVKQEYKHKSAIT